MTEKPCTKCGKEPRISGQRWGKKCRARYMRGWRKAHIRHVGTKPRKPKDRGIENVVAG